MGVLVRLITGAAGSGTTYMAALHQELGYDMGDDVAFENARNQGSREQVRGLEHKGLGALLTTWSVQFMPTVNAAEPRASRNLHSMLAVDDAHVAGLVRAQVQEVSKDLPELVKQPLMMRWLGLWLMAGGWRPDHVIVMVRNTLQSALSNQRDGFTTASSPLIERIDTLVDYGLLFEANASYNLPHTIIYYPRCAEDFIYVSAKLDIANSLNMHQVHARLYRAPIGGTGEEMEYREEEELDIPDSIPTLGLTDEIMAEVSDDGEEITFTYKEDA